MTCQRLGCPNTAKVSKLQGRPRKFCGDKCRIAVAQGRGFRHSPHLTTPTPEAPKAESDAVCRESWWVGASRAAFTEARVKREEVLRPAFGSQPVFTLHSRAERTFMDSKGGW